MASTNHLGKGYLGLLSKVTQVTNEILRDGFGEISISFEITKGAKRLVTVKHGISDRFVVPTEEVPDCQ